MATVDSTFTGSIPALYDQYLGPLIFEPYAGEMAERVARRRPRRVLETACGTGILTRALVRALPAAEIVATDFNQPMVDFAAAQPGAARVKWRRADAMSLPFAERSFDAVACQFGAMFFPDRVVAYREALRVLRPGGQFVFAVWDRIDANAFADVVTAAVAGLFPDDPPRFLARTPHGYHDTAAIRADLVAAGFGTVAIETITRRSRAASAETVAIGFCQGTPLRNEIDMRAPAGIGAATEAAAGALQARFGSGPIDAEMQAHVVVAVP